MWAASFSREPTILLATDAVTPRRIGHEVAYRGNATSRSPGAIVGRARSRRSCRTLSNPRRAAFSSRSLIDRLSIFDVVPGISQDPLPAVSLAFACPAKPSVSAKEIDHQLHRCAGVPVVRPRAAVRGRVAEVLEPAQPIDRYGELQTGMLSDRDVVAECCPLVDTPSLRLRQLIGQTTDVSAQGDLECGGGVDDRAPVGVASLRSSCVAAKWSGL